MWRYTGLYEVSDQGRVRRIGGGKGPFPRVLRGRIQSEGYVCVTLCRDAISHTQYVHRLVARAFLPRRPSSRHVVFRWKQDRKNNRASNLYWGLPPLGRSKKGDRRPLV